MKRILGGLLLILSVVAGVSADTNLILNWSFNRTNNLFTYSYEAKSNHFYGLVRYDIAHDYYDLPFYDEGTNVGLVVFELDPMVCCDPEQNLNQDPSGIFWFYLYDLSFEEALFGPQVFGVSQAMQAREAIVVGGAPRPVPPPVPAHGLPPKVYPQNRP